MPPKPTTSTATAPTAWDNVPDMHGIVPWQRTGLSRADIIHMLAKEAKACLYELLRAHVEHAYGRSGWPAEPKAWRPLERERDAVVGAAELLPDERYGLTYGAARREPLSHGSYGSPKALDGLTSPRTPAYGAVQRELLPDGSYGPERPLDELALPRTPPLNLLWGLWTGNYFHADPSNKTLPALLVQYEYAEDLKEEIQTAFADFESFEIGHGAGRGFMGRLRKNEQGRNALEAWDVCRKAYLNRRFSDLLHEPFGIERDFTYLYHAACWTLGAVLLKQQEQQLGEFAYMQLGQFKQRDSLGVAPSDLYNGSRPFVDGRTEPFQLKRWIKLYLKQVEAVAQRWRDRDRTDVDDRLGALREQVCTWDRAAWGVNASPRHRTEVEAAQRKIVEGIEAMKLKGAPRTTTTKASKPKGMDTKPQAEGEQVMPRTLAERLDAVQGARQAFDEMLKMDGFMDDAGKYALKSRKGKGGILANWDAVVERFALEGFAHDKGLPYALMEYIPGLTIQERIGKLREGNVYKDGLRSAKAHLKR